MGSLQAQEMSELASLDAGLTWHLRANHYPPIPVECVEIAKQAIEKADLGEWEYRIDTNPEQLPAHEAPVVHRHWGTQIPVHVLIDGWHLRPWLDHGEAE